MKTNLGAARKYAGYTQQSAADALGIPVSTLRKWEQGVYEPDIESIISFARLYKTTTDTILGTQFADSSIVSPDSGPTATCDVRVFGRIAAGTPIDMEEGDYMFPAPTALMERHPNAFYLVVDGESMNRVLPNGCMALVDPDQREPVINGLPYAVCVNGYSATIKRIRKLQNGFELVPDSSDPTYRPSLYDYGEPGTETVAIIGRVVWYSVPLDWDV